MKYACLIAFALLSPIALPAQQSPAEAAPLTARFTDLLQRSSDGRSPTDDDLRGLSANPTPVTPPELKQALPLILKALDNSDAPVRAYALTTLTTLEDPPAAAPDAAPAVPADPNASAQTTVSAAASPAGPATYKPDIQKLLAPSLQRISAHLTEEVQSNRLLTATILGGFTPTPPSAVFIPLLAYLKRDDAVSPVGQAVVEDLLELAPVTPATAVAIATYLRRTDQTSDTRANLIDAIASAPNQSQPLNMSLIVFLDSDDPSLRARVILSLPALDLAPDVFSDARSRVATLAGNDQENLQVVNAAKSVSTCWTAVKMPTGCPVYQ